MYDNLGDDLEDFNEIEADEFDIISYLDKEPGSNIETSLIFYNRNPKLILLYISPDIFYGVMFCGCYVIKYKQYHIELQQDNLMFISNKIKSGIVVRRKFYLKDFLNIIESPIDLELDYLFRDIDKYSNPFNEEILRQIRIDIDQISLDKKLSSIESLRLFL